MRPLFKKHQDDIITGVFSTTMMKDWDAGDVNLLGWRAATNDTAFEQTAAGATKISEQEYFDHAVLMVAMVKAGVELAFECMVEVGMKPESAYYESLHETPLIANLISRKKLYEMNKVISDTAEYGCYLFSHAAVPLLKEFMSQAVDRRDRQGLRARQPAGRQPPPARREPGHREPPGREGRRHAARPHDGDEADLRRWLSRLSLSRPHAPPEPGLTLVTGPNGSGKSTAARALEARVAGSRLLSAESQQAFYEAQLAADESNFKQGVDTSSSVRRAAGRAGRAVIRCSRRFGSRRCGSAAIGCSPPARRARSCCCRRCCARPRC